MVFFFKCKILLTPLSILLENSRIRFFLSNPEITEVILSSCFFSHNSVSHAHSWKLLKPHMFAIIQDVLFPLMSYSEADEELWNTDPHEYIRIKFGKFSKSQPLAYSPP